MNKYIYLRNFDLLYIISIGISAIRFLGMSVLAFSVAYTGVFTQMTVFGIVLFVVLDQLDGMLFRCSSKRANSSARAVRRVLDSTIDRAAVQLVNLGVLLADPDYLVLFLAVLLREILVSAQCIAAYREGYVLYPNSVSKCSTISVAFVGIAYLLHDDALAYVFALFMLCSAVCAVSDYGKRLKAIRQGRGKIGTDFEPSGLL